jgi:hypothetical protein
VGASVRGPLSVTLQPHPSINTSLTFEVPGDARGLRFTGGVPGISYAGFIIGNGDLLHKPRVELHALNGFLPIIGKTS